MNSVLIRKRHLIVTLTIGLFAGLMGTARADSLTQYEPEPMYTYVHDELNISVTYPWSWVSNPTSAPVIHDVGDPEQLPNLRVMVMDEPWWLPLRFSGRAALTQISRLGRNVDVISNETLEHKGTRFNLTELRWTIAVGPGVDLHTLLASAFLGDRWVIAMVSSGQFASHREGLADASEEPFPEELKAVALSLKAVEP
ncbi:MAG: hypothetical protein AAGG11_15890 [Pseudomonadota bacterium]